MRRDDRPDRASPSAWRRFRVAAGSTVGGWIIRLLGMTWRMRRVGAAAFDDLRARKEPFIAVFWHGEILPVTWAHRGMGFAALISRHDDGEIIARVVEGLGLNTVRGSTTRGGVRALLESAQLLNNGVSLAITPDGPRGPRHEFAPGALIVAQRTGRPIVAIAATASRAWHARSWDRHLVPKPFARVTITYSEAQFVQAGTARDAVQEQAHFGGLLESLAERP
jgi:lysophospholipid acyltransferase (LPLAT)-like uncharacterized protein